MKVPKVYVFNYLSSIMVNSIHHMSYRIHYLIEGLYIDRPGTGITSGTLHVTYLSYHLWKHKNLSISIFNIYISLSNSLTYTEPEN
jgi:hypothetical protein